MDSELESFLTKFRGLWNSGFDAHLELESHAGQAWVSLRVRLGHAPGPVQHPRHFAHQNRTRNGPSRQRRRERRAEARRLATEEAVLVDGENAEEAEDRQVADKADTNLSEAAVKVVEDKSDQPSEQARNDFSCLICDFVSSWETGLQIHMTKKHSMVEQVDGNATLTDDDVLEDDKYSDTSHYWKTGLLGTAFQTFLDANEIINSSNLSEVTKEIEKAKVLEARKCAFGENYKYVPPWKQ